MGITLSSLPHPGAVTVPDFIDIPTGWVVTWDRDVVRSGEPVRVIRWQPGAPRHLGGQHVSVVVSRLHGARLISYRRFVEADGDDAPLPDLATARQRADRVLLEADPHYARRLSPMRIERQHREWCAADGHTVLLPALWVRSGDARGAFAWVTIGPSGRVIEFERDARWELREGRRASEEWDNDAWVAAREGSGPQLPPPHARA